ncbi:MAG TPA: bifunctional acetate--CoA ligase family protein/GNAT family N-acetyltransferase [Burkholderiaceae bacterium]|nr:bifunctional acetate--CoA ligase family protein/GNAT family N-acetyltransferase [Burkholderiaceae bacterium]
MQVTTHSVHTALVPRSVAIVGATERVGALGRDVFRNVLAGGFQGEVFAVNPKHNQIGEHRCYARLTDLPTPPDLVVVVTPAAAVPQVVKEAAERGVAGVLVLSAGFAEVGPAGVALQEEALARAGEAGVRIIGPNCLGLMRPSIGLNATFARTAARAGNIGLVSQSGAVAAALLDYAWSAGFGFSSVITTGDGSDVEFGDLLDFLALDAQTRSIVLYVEGVHRPRQFLSSLRAAASIKPVIVLKAGRHASGSKAAFSHTGALAGDDAVFDTALRRTGAIRISRYAQLFSASEALLSGRLPRGSRLAILTNGGGPGVLAADAASDVGVTLALLGGQTKQSLDAVLPATWSKANPIDIVGDADCARFSRAFELVLADEANDGVLVLFCPTIRLGAAEIARALIPLAAASSKPVVSAWLGEADAAQGRSILKQAGYAAMRSPEQGVEAFAFLAQCVRHRQLRLQLPPPISGEPEGASPLEINAARAVLAQAQQQGRTVLAEDEAKSLLSACGIEVVQGRLASSAAEAKSLAEQIGYPVVLKVRAEGITHKSDVGGVLLGLKSPEEVGLGFELIRERVLKRATEAQFRGVLVQRMVSRPSGRELIVGISRDPAFGPVISFGMGGIAVEVVRDSALALPPLNRMLAGDLIDRTRVSSMLKAFRGMPSVDMDSLIDTLLRVSELACEFPCLAELDINPLLADENGVIALDARVRIDAGPLVPDPVYSHLAIHPYPKALEAQLHLGDGTLVLLRPVRPEDAEAQRRFVARLSDLTLYRRFHAPVRELTLDRLVRFTQIDYDREMAFVAIDASGEQEEIRGFAQYNRVVGSDQAEFGIAVEDSWQGRGLGFAMMAALESCARERQIAELFGYVLADNESMRGMMVARGYRAQRQAGETGVIRFHLPLAEQARADSQSIPATVS